MSDNNGNRIDLSGQTALVTGAGRGIGRGYAIALAGAGAKVAVIARSADELGETVQIIRESQGIAAAFPSDVTDEKAIEGIIETIEGDLGSIDLLVNNAGVAGPLGPAWLVDMEEWWRSIEINLRGPLVCIRAVLPGMLSRGKGRIINVASSAGTFAVPNFSGYVTGKAALIRLTEVLAVETKDSGVCWFAIQPGTVRTHITESIMQSPDGKKWMPWFKTAFETEGDISPADAAAFVLRLASGKVDGLSGRFISVDDDLDQLLQQMDDIRENDLYTLRVRKIGS